MAKRYRLTPIHPSSDPTKPRESENLRREQDHYLRPLPYDGLQVQPQVQQQGQVHKSRVGGWIWGFIGLVALIIIVVAAIWMSGVSASLSHLNHTTEQNAHRLAQQHAQLTGIQAQLQQISRQLAQISQQISAFFGNIMQAIGSGKL